MAHALRYFCSWETEVYKHQMRLELWEKDYKGEATAMVLSGEPKLTMEEGDTICGSSFDFGLLSETNGQYLHLYTTDNHKYLIKILRNSAVMWEGYLLPEYYSEAYIAAPYTVSFTATDWLGMLKNVDFPAEDMRVPILQIIKTCLQYTELPLDFACQLDLRVDGINDTTNVLGALYLNPITFTGYNCYEVLEMILASFNATLRQTGHRWLISSIDDEVPLRLISWDSLSYTGDGQSNNGELIGTNFAGTFIDGSMTMAIEPAKKSVDLSQDIFYRESWLKDYDFHSADAWTWPANSNIYPPGLAYYIKDGVLLEQISVDYLIANRRDSHELLYLSQVINVEGAPDDSEYTLGIKFFTPYTGDNMIALLVKVINRSSTSLTQDVAYLSKDGWTNEESYIELNGTSAEPKYISTHTYNRGGRQYLIYDKENWPTTKINFISIPYTGTLEIRIEPWDSTCFGGVYLTKTNITKNLTISSSLNPDAAETASSVNLMLCDSPEERNVELGVLNYFSLSDGALTTGKKWYYNGQEYEDFLHVMAYSYSRCYANKRQKLSGALYTDKIYNLCSFTDKWSGKRHTIKSWIYSIISERLDSMEIIETPAKEIELTLSTPEAGSSNKQNQPSGGTSGGGATSMAGSGRYVNLDTAQEVSGEKTWNDKATFKKDIVVEGDGIFGGEVVAIVGDAEPAGVTNYAQLQGKPSINGKELVSGNNTLEALGIQPKGDYASKSAVNDIQALIPATATADNQLADKDFVNSSIATATAEFRGSFTSLDELKATSGNLNDYAFYLHTDDVGNKVVDRYKWTTAGWLYEYTLNNSSFTAEQWAALNSAITATLVNSYNSHLNNSTIHITAAERTAWNSKWNYNEATIKAVKVTSASSADSVAWSGIKDKPSTIAGYGITDTYTKTETNNMLSGYLSLTGGIITGTLAKRHTGQNYITFQDSDGNTYGFLGFNGANTPIYIPKEANAIYTLIHSGNYNSYAPTLTGTGASGTWGISISGNAATATKLQTSRTIWGKPFDGSANVDGDLKDVGNITASGKATIQGDIISGGEVAAVVGESTPVGVADYSALTGKPAINGVTLISGNNTLVSLGIQPAGNYITESLLNTKLDNYTTKTFVANNYAGKSAFNAHIADTDIHITAEERVAWNAKWDYNENTIKAVKVNSAVSADSANSVAWSGISDKPTSLKNPYALTFGSKTYDGSAAATITASDLGALTAHQTIYAFTLQVNGTSQGVYNPASAAKTINIAVPTKTSDITNDSGFITNASIPTALKNPYAVEIKANGVSLGTYDGSAAAAFNLSAANVGAARKVHTHYSIVTERDNRNIATTPNDYANSFVFRGLKDNTIIGSPSSDIYSYLIGLRGWSDDSGGSAHELAFNNSGIFIRQGSSTEWGSWYQLIDTGNFTKSLVEGVLTGNITSHTHTFASLTSKPTTIAGYGITDALTTSNYNSYAPTLTGTGASGTWGIDISGNASSATKLQTSRTIWGQSFDGSAHIPYTAIPTMTYVSFNKDARTSIGYIGKGGSADHLYFGGYDGVPVTLFSNDKRLSNNLTVATTGNVLIGTLTDNGYKLQVNGSERVYGDLIVDGEVSALVA